MQPSAPNGLRIVETKHIFGDNQIMLRNMLFFLRKTMHFGMHPKCTEWTANCRNKTYIWG